MDMKFGMKIAIAGAALLAFAAWSFAFWALLRTPNEYMFKSHANGFSICKASKCVYYDNNDSKYESATITTEQSSSRGAKFYLRRWHKHGTVRAWMREGQGDYPASDRQHQDLFQKARNISIQAEAPQERALENFFKDTRMLFPDKK